ncbi:MAG TPA: hypothetical protein DCR69_01920 [Clostridium sp.]|nr:hypothetical protein [Clostridium sp.]
MDKLYVFLEGDDDERYFRYIVEPILKSKGIDISYYLYRTKKKGKVMSFIKSIDRMEDSDYIFISDIDLCIDEDQKRERLYNTYNNLDLNKTFIVIKEIESWYLAGLDDLFITKQSISIPSNTNNVDKERFRSILSKSKLKRFSLSTCMIEILENYNIKKAIEKNYSLKNFIELIS